MMREKWLRSGGKHVQNGPDSKYYVGFVGHKFFCHSYSCLAVILRNQLQTELKQAGMLGSN